MTRDEQILVLLADVVHGDVARIIVDYSHELSGTKVITGNQTQLDFLVAHKNKDHYMVGLRCQPAPPFGCFYQWHDNWCHTAFGARPQGETLALISLPNGQIAAGKSSGRICLYSGTTMEVERHVVVSFHGVTALAVLSNTKTVFGTRRGEVGMLVDGCALACFTTCYKEQITAIAPLHNGNVVVGDVHGRLFWLNSKFKSQLFFRKGIPTSVTALAVLANGQIVSSYLAYALQVWDPDTGECVRDVHLHETIVAMCVLRDGRLATGSNNGCVRVLDPDTFECVSTLSEDVLPSLPTQRKICMAVLENGTLAVSIGKNQTVWA